MSSKKVDILAFGVHPDDIELSCSGTLLKHIALGYTVAVVDLTQGELGSRGSAELRLQEAKKAANVLGISARENLSMSDGWLRNTPESQFKVIEMIRKYRPGIVLANALEDRHPDHGRAAQLVAESCFYAGLLKIDTGQDEWRPKALYHYIQDQNLIPDFVVDISSHFDQKMESILCYRSQFFEENQTGPKTPISGKDFLDFIKAKNKSMGRNIQVDYAEGFNKSRIFGVDDLFDLR